MTTTEFSNQFDVLYNNITSNQGPGIDEYEKSVFLTKAQDEILKAYFDPRSNKVMEGYDTSKRRQIDFSMVTRTIKYIEYIKDPSTSPPAEPADGSIKYLTFGKAIFDPRSNSKSVAMPSNILMVLNERLVVKRTEGAEDHEEYLTVLPIIYTEIDRVMSKPYKRPLKYQAWRIFNFAGDANKSDLVVGPSDEIKEYTFRYVRRPNPIILANLDGLTIDGKGDETKCELDPILHEEILQRAAELAKAAYMGDLNSTLTLGNLSQTQIGVVPQSKD